MKRQFSLGFKALAACAMSAMLAVSCYDDSELWKGLEDLEGRVAALEEMLNTEVATLNSKIGAVETALKTVNADALAALTEELDALDGVVDGYIKSNDAALKAAIDELKKADAALADVDTDVLASLAKLGVVSVEKDKDGKTVVTFTDGSTLEVANESGIVTVVDGKWAVVVDGKTTVLDALVHPDTTIDFRVGDDNTLYVSYDGKKTWETTGVVVNDETTFNVVTDVKYTEGDAYVTLVVGKTEYQLPVYKADNSSLVLGRTDVFFMYGASKNIELSAEAIVEDECYVIAKPDGWKATLDGSTLTVTAPAKELVENGAGELEGEVLIHANTVTGTCKVVKLDVTTGEALTLSYEDGNVTVFNALSYTRKQGGWYEITEFYDARIGITPVEEFMEYASFNEFVADNTQSLLSSMSYYAMMAGLGDTYYDPGVREEQNITIPLSFIVEDEGLELEEDGVYVIWVLPMDGYGSDILYDEARYVLTENYASFSASNETYNNADLSIKYLGADGFFIGATSKTVVDLQMEGDLDMYLQYGPYWQGGPWMDFTAGDNEAMGTLYLASDDKLGIELDNLHLADVVLPNYMGERFVDSGHEFYVWLLPYYEGKPVAEYSLTDLIKFTCETEPLVYDEDVKATVNYTASPYTISFNLTSPDGGTTYYYYLSRDEYDGFLADYTQEELRDVIKGWCSEPLKGTMDYTIESWEGVKPNQEWALVTYSTCEGYHGDAVVTIMKTPAFDEYIATLEAGATYKLTKDVTLEGPIVVTKDLTIDLNGKNITAPLFTESNGAVTAGNTDSYVFWVKQGAKLTINGNGEVKAQDCKYSMAVWAEGGEVVINGGTYSNGGDSCDLIYVSADGSVEIYGGEFKAAGPASGTAPGTGNAHSAINLKDNTGSSAVVYGGTFYGFDPANNVSEGANTNFVAEGYESRETAENVYTVAMRTPNK